MTRPQLLRASLVLAACGVLGLLLLTHIPFCPLAGVFGIPCPGCGLTRASLALLHGQLRQALHFHPLVPVLMPMFVWVLSRAAFSYVRGPRPDTGLQLRLSSRTATLLASTLLLATMGVWGARFCGYFGGPAAVTTFKSWLGAETRKP